MDAPRGKISKRWRQRVQPADIFEEELPQSRRLDRISIRPRRRRSRVWLLILLILVLGIALLPTIVSRTSLRNSVLDSVCRRLGIDGTIRAEGAAWGWFSGLSAEKIQLIDAKGEQVLVLENVEWEKSLLALITNRTQLGTIEIRKPNVYLELRAKGSNLEDVLGAILNRQPEPGPRPELHLKVVDGVVAVHSKASKQDFQLQQLGLDLQLPGEQASPSKLDLSGVVSGKDGGGSFSLQSHFIPRQNQNSESASSPWEQASLELKSDSFPLALFQPVMRRMGWDAMLSGEADAELKFDWSDLPGEQVEASVDGIITGTNVTLAGRVDDESVQLDTVEIPLKAQWSNGKLLVERLEANTPIGNLACQFDLADAEGLFTLESPAELFTVFTAATAEVTGNIKVAELAMQLPNSLRLQESLSLTDGEVKFALNNKPSKQGAITTASFNATRLAGLHDGKEVSWERPLSAACQLVHTTKGLVVKELTCDSDFLKLSGQGNASQADVDLEFDLQELAIQAKQFLEMDDMELIGAGQGNLHWTTTPNGLVKAQTEIVVSDLTLVLPDSSTFYEPEARLVASAEGVFKSQEKYRLKKGVARLTLGEEVIDLQTTSDWEPDTALSTAEYKVHATAKLGSWLSRLTTWTNQNPGFKLSGDAEIDSLVRLNQGNCQFQDLAIDVQKFRLVAPGIRIDEPDIKAEGNLEWRAEERAAQIPSLAITSKTANLQIREAIFQPEENPWPRRLSGSATVRADLARLQRISEPNPNDVSPWRVAGRMSGTMVIAPNTEGASLDLNAMIDNLTVDSKEGTVWTERRMELMGKAAYDAESATIDLDGVSLSSNSIRAQVDGTISDLVEQGQVDLQGELQYDMEMIARLLRPIVGNEIKFRGNRRQKFDLSGPLALNSTRTKAAGNSDWLREWQGQTTVGWQSAELFGERIQGADIDVRLANGLVQFSPLDIQALGGRIQLSPQLRLSPEPRVVILEPGTVIENIQVNKEVRLIDLRYILPSIEGAPQINGRYSMSLDQAEWNVDSPEKSDVSGRIKVHDLEIVPGPLVRELALLLGHNGSVQLKKESEIEFRMVDGRVYHRNLALEFPDMTIQTHGSVGLDQSIALIAEMPFPKKWIGKNPLGKAFKDRKLQIPISGTLQKPKLDRQVLQKFAAEQLEDTAREKIQGELEKGINKGLEKLLEGLDKQN